MEKALKFKILSEGQQKGVSKTCEAYGISRTLYYRWLKNYKTKGMDGLDTQKKGFVPQNKTNLSTEYALLQLVKDYPHYGPRALKYLFDELGYCISESAIYNILKRHNLTHKQARLNYVNKQTSKLTSPLPSLDSLTSGSCWLFWITDYGYYDGIGQLFEYTLYDVKSRIACTRLYDCIAFSHFEDLLAGVAMPVAQNLNLHMHYLCFFKDTKLIKASKKTFKSKMTKILSAHHFDFNLHLLLPSNPDFATFIALKNNYTEGCLSFIMPLIKEGISFSALKIKFQHYLRHYNLNEHFSIDGQLYSPVGYHNKLTSTKLILPLWAYIDRHY